MKKRSIKNIRINAEVQKELGNIIRNEVKDPRISPMAAVVNAEVSPDLKYCKAYISVLGDEETLQSTMEGLRSAAGYIRSRLAQSVNLRNTPELTFILDQSIEYGVRMSQLIDKVAAEIPDEAPEEGSGEEPETGSDDESGEGSGEEPKTISDDESEEGSGEEPETVSDDESEEGSGEEPGTVSGEVSERISGGEDGDGAGKD